MPSLRRIQEGVMRRMLFALAAGLLAFSGLTSVDGPHAQPQDDKGTIVLWRAIDALHEAHSPDLVVGGIIPLSGWLWVEGGKASLNVHTGRFQIDIKSVSWMGPNYAAGEPIRAKLDRVGFPREGRFVCDSLGRSGGPLAIRTDAFYFDDTGSAHVSGVINELPKLCRDYPDQIAFLIGGVGKSNYFLFGTERAVLSDH
jgi:hypothetical protein